MTLQEEAGAAMAAAMVVVVVERSSRLLVAAAAKERRSREAVVAMGDRNLHGATTATGDEDDKAMEGLFHSYLYVHYACLSSSIFAQGPPSFHSVGFRWTLTRGTVCACVTQVAVLQITTQGGARVKQKNYSLLTVKLGRTEMTLGVCRLHVNICEKTPLTGLTR